MNFENCFYRFFIVCLLLVGCFANAGERLALVIGNAEYRQKPLQNAVNDAEDLSKKLRELGFTVTLHKNLEEKAMRRAFRQFGKKVTARTEIAWVFYSGHGAQYDNKSYLIPIGADIQYADDLPSEAVDAQNMLTKFENKGAAVNVMILDACRNLPFPIISETKEATRGLAPISGSHGSNTVIVYSTKPGAVANDVGKNGRNSPYTETLLAYITMPKTTLTQMFDDVNYAVKHNYARQIPMMKHSGLPRIYLNPKNPKEAGTGDTDKPQDNLASQSILESVKQHSFSDRVANWWASWNFVGLINKINNYVIVKINLFETTIHPKYTEKIEYVNYAIVALTTILYVLAVLLMFCTLKVVIFPKNRRGESILMILIQRFFDCIIYFGIVLFISLFSHIFILLINKALTKFKLGSLLIEESADVFIMMFISFFPLWFVFPLAMFSLENHIKKIKHNVVAIFLFFLIISLLWYVGINTSYYSFLFMLRFN